ncbi:hypothetical protein MNBD_ACTINO02-3307 [hydrothermal vent metagenome]|uniref:Uncharacterized protein n=1 Tax=hydrothermal vent metagenome TaxID=652676 RepID=A0A3B0S7I1_9ZZZZ
MSALKLFAVAVALFVGYRVVMLAIFGASLEFEPNGVFYGNKTNDLVGYGMWLAAGILISPTIAFWAFRSLRKRIAIAGAIALAVGLAAYVRYVTQLSDLT